MKASIHCLLVLFGLIFTTPVSVIAQQGVAPQGVALQKVAPQYTTRDQDEIAHQAKLTLSMYKDLLNVIAYKGLATESEIQELIRNSYTHSRSRIFYSQTSVIEDNIDPSKLFSQFRQDKSIKDYLQYFDLVYEKSEGATIEFSDFEVSSLKFSDYLYIQVKFTSLFKGKHKENPAPYKSVDRLAEFRVEKQGNKWKTFITSIVYDKSEDAVHSKKDNVKLKRAVPVGAAFTQLTGKIQKENGRASGSKEKSSSQNTAQDSVFNHHLEIGKKALAAEKLDEAFAAFSEAENINPYHQELRKKLMELAKAQNRIINSVENSFEFAKRNADKAYAARDYIRARNLYSEALRLRPEVDQLKVEIEKLDRIIQKLALLESKYSAGEYKEAVKDYNKAIRNDKDNPDYYYGRGKCYEKLDDVKEAFEDYSKAIELDGNFIEALSSRARLYTETNQLHQAIADYTLILSNPDYAAVYYPERASVKELVGDYRGAVEDYDAAIRLNPGNADFHFRKGMVLLKQKDIREAIQSFSVAVEKDAQHVNAFFQRGLAFAAMENLESAAADFEMARELGLEEPQLAQINKLTLKYFTRGEGAMVEKKYSRALEAFRDALLLSPAFGRAWLRAGDALFELQQYDEALENYNNAVKYDQVSFALFRRGVAWQQQGDEQSAINDFRKYIPIGIELVARARDGKPDKKSAASEVSFVEDVADTYYALGYAQLMTQQYVEALDNLDMAIRYRKFFPKAYFARGSALYALEDYKRAVKNMEESIRMGLTEPLVFYSLGKAYVANQQLEDAIYSYSHTLKLDPEYEAAYRERSICYKNYNQYDLALQDVNTVISLNENLKGDVVLMTHKGILELYLNKFREAKQSLDQALRLDESNAWALYGKACVLAQEQKLEESLELYRRAFQTRQIDWSVIKNDPLIHTVSKEKAFKELVKTYL